jgi:hypothetical protein
MIARPQIADFAHDGAILAMWKVRMDTYMIAKVLHIPESEIANRLARLRDAGAA